jgi:predicted RNase H-like HicB family nuclease
MPVEPGLRCLKYGLGIIWGVVKMRGQFTLEFWRDGNWFVGRLLEVPGAFSQGETLEELQENIQDAYDMMVTQERVPAPPI